MAEPLTAPTNESDTEALLHSLPPVLRAVVRALGFGRASEWLSQYGGVNVNIPKFKARTMELDENELTRLREALSPHMDAHGRVPMPKPDKLFIRVRDAQINREKGHASINQQARQYHLTARHILNIRRQADAVDNQLDLF